MTVIVEVIRATMYWIMDRLDIFTDARDRSGHNLLSRRRTGPERSANRADERPAPPVPKKQENIRKRRSRRS